MNPHRPHAPGLILRGIDFGCVLDASGVRNFNKKGWWYHRFAKYFGLDFTGSTFVAKTTTLNPRLNPPDEGIMPMKQNGITPQELFPKCIHVNWRTQAAVNAVGLSGPGLDRLLQMDFWQRQTEPFFISIMSVAATPEARIAENATMARMILDAKPNFRAPFGIQINFSCPNTTVSADKKCNEIHATLDAVSIVGVPLMPKLAPGTYVSDALDIARNPFCDAICVFNTLLWDKAPEALRMQYFGTTISPLKKYGIKVGGGISGRPLFDMTREWVLEARARGLTKPLNAGGGILSPYDALIMFEAGAESIFLGSIAFLNPFRVRQTVQASLQYRLNS